MLPLILLIIAFLLGMTWGLWLQRCRTTVIITCGIAVSPSLIYLITSLLHTGDLWAEPWGNHVMKIFQMFLLYGGPPAAGCWIGHTLRRHLLPRKPWVLSAFLVVIAIFIIAILPQMSSNREKARLANCAWNLRQIGIALALYADTNHGSFPSENGARGLLVLTNCMQSRIIRLVRCPSDFNWRSPSSIDELSEDNCSYVYAAGRGLIEGNTNAVPVCWDKADNHLKGLNVLFLDGHVQFLTFAQWEAVQKRN